MNKKAPPPILLLLTIPLGELYQLWHVPEVRLRGWFLLSDLQQDIEWYVKDSSEGVIWLIFIYVWYLRERKRSTFWSKLLGLFFIFRAVDLCAYWVNHRHAGLVYLFCYLSIIIYVGIIFYRNKHKHDRNEK